MNAISMRLLKQATCALLITTYIHGINIRKGNWSWTFVNDTESTFDIIIDVERDKDVRFDIGPGKRTTKTWPFGIIRKEGASEKIFGNPRGLRVRVKSGPLKNIWENKSRRWQYFGKKVEKKYTPVRSELDSTIYIEPSYEVKRSRKAFVTEPSIKFNPRDTSRQFTLQN